MLMYSSIKEGALVVGGHAKYEVPVCLRSLARKQQMIIGVSNGTRCQLENIVSLVATGQVSKLGTRVKSGGHCE